MNDTSPQSTDLAEHRLFFFQLGPVQEFIAQARSTRDLWSGSYLLSWMTGHIIYALQARSQSEGLGPAEIVFPRLQGEAGAMFRWIQARGSTPGADPESATFPTVPNRILAVVPAAFTESHAQAVVNTVFQYRPAATQLPEQPSEWERICWTCYRWFAAQAPALFQDRPSWPRIAHDPTTLWHRQLARFWQPTWLLWPTPRSANDDYALFLQTPIGKNWHAHFPHQTPDPWMLRYHLALHRFDARRQTRDFGAWDGQAGFDKDSLSGKEEAIADADWFERIPRGQPGKGHTLNHLFRNSDPLGAPNLVKRVWHKAYLEAQTPGGLGLDKEALGGPTARGSYFDFPSVPGVAVFPWACEIWRRRDRSELKQFWTAVEELDAYLDLDLPQRMDWAGETAHDWLARVDWAVFREEFWLEQLRDAEAARNRDWIALARRGRAALDRFLADSRLRPPSSYYAVLAGDGDHMGKWLSGELPDASLRSMTLDEHRRISEGIGRFSTQNAQMSRLVEDVSKQGSGQQWPFQGKIIYAGGEDVLALLPAEQAIGCARALRRTYQSAMPHPSDDNRFTYSVGIAIGHVKAPLQDMVEAAQAAERRAKHQLGRNALAVTLLKRSGETIEWGCPFGIAARDPSAGLQLLDFIQTNHRFRSKPDDPAYHPPISGRFPHRLAALLSRYQAYAQNGGLPNRSRPEPLSAELRAIAEREFEWAVQRQCEKLPDHDRMALLDLGRSYLAEIQDRQAPLQEFYQLFAVEAFIARQGE